MGFLERLFGTAPQPKAARSVMDSARQSLALIGEGRFDVPVVGESRYLAAFERVFGTRTPDGIDQECLAILVLEDENPVDDRAVRIEIKDNRSATYRANRHANTEYGLRQVTAAARTLNVEPWSAVAGIGAAVTPANLVFHLTCPPRSAAHTALVRYGMDPTTVRMPSPMTDSTSLGESIDLFTSCSD